MENLINTMKFLKKYVCSIPPTKFDQYSESRHGCESYNAALDDVISILRSEKNTETQNDSERTR